MLNVYLNIQAEQKVFGERSVQDRLCIMLYEIGSLAKCVVHGDSTLDDKEKAAYYASALTELSDLLLQCNMLRVDVLHLLDQIPNGKSYQVSFHDLVVDGVERQLERMTEWGERREEARRGRGDVGED